MRKRVGKINIWQPVGAEYEVDGTKVRRLKLLRTVRVSKPLPKLPDTDEYGKVIHDDEG